MSKFILYLKLVDMATIISEHELSTEWPVLNVFNYKYGIITKFSAMDNIVVGFSLLNFKQNLGETETENCVPNWAKEETTEMTSSENYEHSYLTNSTALSENNWEVVERDDEIVNQNKGDRRGYSFSERRKMPSRASKSTSLLGIKRRTIMKPTKHSALKQEDFNNIKPAAIKKIYLNKKLTNFRPSSLETIFEEMPYNDDDEQSCSRIMSARKIRRIVCFSDGYKYTKTMVNRRRTKIKKSFGRRFALKKISLEEFITKLNKSMDENEESFNQNDQQNMQEGQTVPEIENQFQCPDMFSGKTSESSIDNYLTHTSISTTAPITDTHLTL